MMDIDDKKDVDMAFFITAHEVAHQWWGLQLEAANVQGQNMILETLAQYSALMVFKEKYPEAKVQQFLKLQWDEYREATLESKKEELPLVLVENESHIYYNKGALVMYKLQELIGEKNVNHALKHFLYDWRSFQNPPKQNRYATSLDFMYFVMDVTPDSLKNVVTDLFEQTNCFVEEDSFIH
jgi:ABC-2 type transport system permease protein